MGGSSQIIMPLYGSILQAVTCKILSLAENTRWSRLWQIRKFLYGCSDLDAFWTPYLFNALRVP